ncbi:uncharacterized protein LOC120180059 [Hibiscus syriacus]|uniref:uncharacterized protein LOC120180059 n=1 Tax=Hibiscus syriacus TaxID=106335 RepID=UPI001922B40A|nr:uncharacterized protein LOC120180059 [Hibiscus syriacus]
MEVLDRQRSYTNWKYKEIEFVVTDNVFLKVSPWKKVLRFGHKGNLTPHFIGHYEVFERIRLVTFRLALPPKLEYIHNVFHISILQRYPFDPSYVLSLEQVELSSDMTCEEKLIQILAKEVKELRNKKILLVKVLWRNHGIREATWETEEDMQLQYPISFIQVNFEDEISY